MSSVNLDQLKLYISFIPLIFDNIFFKFARYIFSRKGAAFASVLVFGNKVVEFAVLSLLITYFTSEKEYGLIKAATLVKIQMGLSECLGIVMVYISDSIFGDPLVIMVSTLCSITGLGILFGASLEEYSDRALIIGPILLAVGKSGLQTLLGPFLADQLRVPEPETNSDKSRVRAEQRVWKLVPSCCGALAALLLIYFINQWRLILEISLWLMGGACSLFCLGIGFYHGRELAGVGSGLSVFFHFIKASRLKKKLKSPTTSNQVFGNDGPHLSHQINIPRCSDETAITESSTLGPEEQGQAESLYTVSKVQLLKLFLLWSTMLVVGLVRSAGETFFSEQGVNMEHSQFYGCLSILQSISEEMVSYLITKLISSKWIPESKKKKAILVAIWFGIVSSICCTSFAWQVEYRKLTIVHSKGLFDKPNVTIPMSIFWLSPQFCLLGFTEGLVTTGMDEFIVAPFPESRKDYVSAINEVVLGLGNFLSIFFVHANRNLFADTMNHSRLDKYYHRLTIVSFINMCFYWFIIYTFYGSRYM